MSAEFDFDFSELDNAAGKVRITTPKMAKDVVGKIAETIMQESLKQVPVDTGALKNTNFVETQETTTGAEAEFGYSGEGINPRSGISVDQYMIKVHEDLSCKHKEGKAKFLEDPVNDASIELEKRLGEAISAKLTKLFHG